jgi:hypothetical protein
MKIKDIYKLVIDLGIKADPRGAKEINRILAENKKVYDKLDPDEKEEFDTQCLVNPFDDTRILLDHGHQVKTILTGIDIDTAEILLADRLTERGTKIDLVLAHHPSGQAFAGFFGVMHMQADILAKHGVPINVAEGILSDRIAEVERLVSPANHNKAVDAAKHLGIGFMCCHTPADNNVTRYLQAQINKKKPKTVRDVISLLKGEPEYRTAVSLKAGPKIMSGKPGNRAGKVVIDMTGGTSGSVKQYEELSDAGIGTLVVMHMKEEHLKEAKKHHMNIIVAGHMASDSMGMNMVLDELEKRGIKILPCSGLIRHSRKGSKKKKK